MSSEATPEEVDEYLATRRAQGFNSFYLMAMVHPGGYASSRRTRPNNQLGDPPFATRRRLLHRRRVAGVGAVLAVDRLDHRRGGGPRHGGHAGVHLPRLRAAATRAGGRTSLAQTEPAGAPRLGCLARQPLQGRRPTSSGSASATSRRRRARRARCASAPSPRGSRRRARPSCSWPSRHRRTGSRARCPTSADLVDMNSFYGYGPEGHRHGRT